MIYISKSVPHTPASDIAGVCGIVKLMIKQPGVAHESAGLKIKDWRVDRFL
jgi:hypothetical protein